MYLAIALKNWKFIVMAALAIALAFSVISCTSKSHQIDLLKRMLNMEGIFVVFF